MMAEEVCLHDRGGPQGTSQRRLTVPQGASVALPRSGTPKALLSRGSICYTGQDPSSPVTPCDNNKQRQEGLIRVQVLLC